jgi:hypothetical protein
MHPFAMWAAVLWVMLVTLCLVPGNWRATILKHITTCDRRFGISFWVGSTFAVFGVLRLLITASARLFGINHY